MKKNKTSVDNAQPLAHHQHMKAKNPAAVALGRLGGLVRGKCKARTSDQARAAALARWGTTYERKRNIRHTK